VIDKYGLLPAAPEPNGIRTRLSRFGMNLCEVLDDAYRAILHVPHGNCSRRWLRVHKVTHILKLGSEIRVGRIVDQHEQLQEDWSPCRGIHSVT